MKKLLVFIVLGFLTLFSKNQLAQNLPYSIALSKDSTLIAYEVYGSSDTALVFVHGWSCDSRYWRNQIDPFSQRFKVILIDLAGHGHSGSTRANYTMESFGEDIKAVIDVTESQNIILIGHSMGGSVIAEAALVIENVIGLIAVDTYANIEYPLTEENLNMMMTPLKDNFQVGTDQFVRPMFGNKTDENIREWVIADMSSAPSHVAINALENYMRTYITGYSAIIFEDINLPIVAVSSDLWPVDSEANRRHMQSFEAIVIENTDHFLMLNRPDDFNKALAQVVEIVTTKNEKNNSPMKIKEDN